VRNRPVVNHTFQTPEDSIDRITVQLYNSPLGKPDIGESEIPKRVYRDLLSVLNGSVLQRDSPNRPWSSQNAFGEITFHLKGNRRVHLVLYWTGKNPIEFQTDSGEVYQGVSNTSDDEGLWLE